MARIKEFFKHTLKSMLMWLDEPLLPFVLPYIMRKKGVKSVHLSIDDVKYNLDSVGGLLLNNNLTLFLHKLDVPITLFLYCKDELKNPCVYKKSALIKIGAHLPSLLLDENLKSMLNAKEARFHCYLANTTEVELARIKGISHLLCSHDSTRLSYNLTKEEQNNVNMMEEVYKNGMQYVKTNIRMEWPIIFQVIRTRQKRMVVFGHEWGMKSWQDKFFKLLYIIKKEDIQIINF